MQAMKGSIVVGMDAIRVYLLILSLHSCSLGANCHQNITQEPVANVEQIEQRTEIQQEQRIEPRAQQEANANRIQDNCFTAKRDLDECSAQLLNMSQGSMRNIDEINDIMCPKFREVSACIKSKSECYKSFERQIIKWVLISTCRMSHKRCKNENEKQKFLRLSQSCFSTKNPLNKCMSNYIANLEAIADLNVERSADDDIQIQLSCCANMRFKQCVMTNAKNNCRPVDSLRKLQRANSVSSQRVVHKYLQRSTLDTIEDLKQSLETMALTGPEFICNSVDESFCQAKFDGKFKSSRPRHKSIVPAMISIYSNKPQ